MWRKVLLVIRDGWGYRESEVDNAIVEWNTPNTDRLMKEYPNILINASGEAVWVPLWFQWNSEVGHMAIWSGRIIFQSLARINKSIDDGKFLQIPVFINTINHCKKNNSVLHLMWLLQIEWVHAYIDHLYALLDLCQKYDFHNVVIHVFTDGRDAPVTKSLEHLIKLQRKLDQLWFGKIVTVGGRYYAMDRDNRRERTMEAYRCIAEWRVKSVEWTRMEFDDVVEMVRWCHENEETDEFILPRKHKDYDWVQENDAIIFWNFRTDRTRQLTQSFVEDDFDGFDRVKKNIRFVAMTSYYSSMNADVAFENYNFDNLLGDIVSRAGYKQLRISETEKYAHVTFFFNGQREKPFENETRILIDSPKVATYDLKPEMSVYKIADRLCEELEKETYQLVVTNLVNGDMVWHTWIPEAIRKGVEAVDKALWKIISTALKHWYTSLVFADHGNAEDQTPKWRTSHTINPVPLILVDDKLKNIVLKSWKGLQDIAPTTLKLMGIEKPNEMTGECIVDNFNL